MRGTECPGGHVQRGTTGTPLKGVCPVCPVTPFPAVSLSRRSASAVERARPLADAQPETSARQTEGAPYFSGVAHLIRLQVRPVAESLTMRANHAIITATGNASGYRQPPMTRPANAAASPSQRSRVTNGSGLLPGVDGRSALARRYRDLVAGITADVGSGASQALLLQVRNAASLQLHAEELTARTVRGEKVDPEAITRANGAASRALSAIRKSIAPQGRRARATGAGGSARLDDYLSRRPVGESPR